MHSIMHSMTASWAPPATFAARLRDARENLDLTIEEAAERCGLSPSTWSTWERGAKPRGMDYVVERICEGLAYEGVPLDRAWLMWGSRPAAPDADPPVHGTAGKENLRQFAEKSPRRDLNSRPTAYNSHSRTPEFVNAA